MGQSMKVGIEATVEEVYKWWGASGIDLNPNVFVYSECGMVWLVGRQ